MKRERFTAKMYVDYYTSHRGIAVSDIGVAPTVILSWGQEVVRSFAQTLAATRSEYWFYDEGHIVYPLYSANIEGNSISIVQCPEGAPATVMMMEELIACGARTFLGLGWAGSLQRAVPIGSLVIPTTCVSHEGTSPHYLQPGTSCSSDPYLAEVLGAAALDEGVQLSYGVQWTTDAPYREGVDTIASFQKEGVIGVDMETSAMYALGQFRGVKVCNLLVVSDELWDDWNPAFRSSKVQEATQLAQVIVLKSAVLYLRANSAR